MICKVLAVRKEHPGKVVVSVCQYDICMAKHIWNKLKPHYLYVLERSNNTTQLTWVQNTKQTIQICNLKWGNPSECKANIGIPDCMPNVILLFSWIRYRKTPVSQHFVQHLLLFCIGWMSCFQKFPCMIFLLLRFFAWLISDFSGPGKHMCMGIDGNTLSSMCKSCKNLKISWYNSDSTAGVVHLSVMQ